MTTNSRPPRVLIWLAFATIYIVWGTTYLAISLAIETIPPFIMSSVRFLIAGVFLFVFAQSRWGGRAILPTRREWMSAALAGFILFVLNNGMIVWAEGYGVPTGVVALLIGTTPMWMVLLNWARGNTRPPALTWAGLLLGLVGVGMLVNVDQGADGTSLLGAGVVILASFCWALGSLYGRSAALPKSPLMSTATQLLWGGVFQGVIALAIGEPAALRVDEISWISVAAMLYLSIISSIIAFTAFTWLMRVSDPARVATYAYVNPIIAFVLGALLLDEPLTMRTVLAAGVIIIGVIFILRSQNRARRALALIEANAKTADTTGAEAEPLAEAA